MGKTQISRFPSHVEVVKSLSSHTNGLHTKGVTARIDIGCLFCIAAGNHTACSVFPFFGCVQEDINLLKWQRFPELAARGGGN